MMLRRTTVFLTTHRLERECDISGCVLHYVAVPMIQNPPETMEEAELRLALKRLARKTAIKDENGCMNFSGNIDRNGYGVFSLMGENWSAHNVAWMLHNQQSIPAAMIIRHLCPVRNRACVNPTHL